MDSKRRREIARAGLFLVPGFIQTAGAVAAAVLFLDLGSHRFAWIGFGIATAAFAASHLARRGNTDTLVE